MNKSSHFPFLISVFGGVFVWLFIFILFPAKVVTPFAKESFWFILLSYCCLIFGYCIVPKLKPKTKSLSIINKRFVYAIVIITIISFLVRYIDLFIFRKVSFFNGVWKNRALIVETKPNFIFIIASILKQLYFIPIVFLFAEKIKDKKLVIISMLLFLLPFAEGYIRGSRNSFFMPIILLFITLLYFKKIRLNKKHTIIIILIISILFTIATSIIMQREASKTDENYTSLTTNFFLNKFLKPNPAIFENIHSTENATIKKIKVSSFQIAQYYVHGVFEFDNLIKHYQKEVIQHQYGKYTFSIINRFTNKYGLTKTNLEDVQLMNPRGITFITFFGGLYIDFGWLGLFIMILYGGFQRFLVNNTQVKNDYYLPLLIFFLFCNFFMLTFNFIKSTGTSIIVVCLIVIFTVTLLQRKFEKKY